MYYLYPVKPLFAKTCEFCNLKSAAVYRILDAKGSHVLTIVVVLGCFLCFFPIATTLRNGGNVLVPCWPSVSGVLFFYFISLNCVSDISQFQLLQQWVTASTKLFNKENKFCALQKKYM